MVALGHADGWRAVYLVVGVSFALAGVAVRLAVPYRPPVPGADARAELRAFRKPQVWLTLTTGAVGFGGLFAAYTYVAPIATEVTGLPATAVPAVLVVFGVGMTAGNLAGGWFADLGAKRAIVVSFLASIVALAFLAVVARQPAGLFAGVLLVGTTTAALNPSLQLRLMNGSAGSGLVGSAVNASALNLGNSLGAFLGGIAVAGGLGYLSTVGVGAVLAVLGLAVAAVSLAVERRSG